MTIDTSRNALGHLPVAKPGEPVCGNACSILNEDAPACQAIAGHVGRCRYYSPNGGGFVEWFPVQPYPVIVLGRLP